MNILVIVAHPSTASFNRAIADTVVRTLRNSGHHVIFHDLHEEGFDPILTKDEIPTEAPLDPVIEQHCRELSAADGIVIVHPNWWGQPPAILKGWIDRVVRAGVAYEFEEGDGGEGVPIGLLKAEAAIVFNTSNTPEQREIGVFGDPLENLWKTCIFHFCGVKRFYRRMFGVIVTSTEAERGKWLDEVQDIVGRFFARA